MFARLIEFILLSISRESLFDFMASYYLAELPKCRKCIIVKHTFKAFVIKTGICPQQPSPPKN